MTRVGLVLTIALTSMGRVAKGESILLASYDFTSTGGHAPESDPRVEFVLQLPATSPPTGYFGLGANRDIFWMDDQPGVHEFTSRDGMDFLQFAQYATDGIEQNISLWDLFPSGSGGASPLMRESSLFSASPDLVGNELEMVRLIVRRIEVDPWVPDPENYPEIEGFRHETELTFEFYGLPIPEPSTIALTVIGAMMIRSLRLRDECWTGGESK